MVNQKALHLLNLVNDLNLTMLYNLVDKIIWADQLRLNKQEESQHQKVKECQEEETMLMEILDQLKTMLQLKPQHYSLVVLVTIQQVIQ